MNLCAGPAKENNADMMVERDVLSGMCNEAESNERARRFKAIFTTMRGCCAFRSKLRNRLDTSVNQGVRIRNSRVTESAMTVGANDEGHLL